MALAGLDGGLLKHPDGDYLTSNIDFNIFDPSTYVTCCGGKCGCRCNILPSGWSLYFHDCVGSLTCLEGETVVVDFGTNELGDPNPCGGANVDMCGPIQFLSCNFNNGFSTPGFPTQLDVGMRVTDGGGSFFINGRYVVGGSEAPDYRMGECLNGGAITSTIVTTSVDHQFKCDVTPIP